MYNPPAIKEKVLVIDDDPITTTIVTKTLDDIVEIHTASTLTEGRQKIDQIEPCVVLLDWWLPDGEGINFLPITNQENPHKEIHTIMLTSRNSANDIKMAFDKNIFDFLIKPCNQIILRSRVLNALRISQQQQALVELSMRDTLTGVFNRRYFIEKTEAEIDRVKRYDRSVSMAIFDIDYFKKINDQFGHPTGDKVLKTVSTLMDGLLRKTDVLARIGGEEFAVLFHESSSTDASICCERIRKRIHDFQWDSLLPKGGKVTISGGLAGYKDGQTFESWFKDTDTALYQSKNSGRNKITQFTEDQKKVG